MNIAFVCLATSISWTCMEVYFSSTRTCRGAADPRPRWNMRPRLLASYVGPMKICFHRPWEYYTLHVLLQAYCIPFEELAAAGLFLFPLPDWRIVDSCPVEHYIREKQSSNRSLTATRTKLALDIGPAPVSQSCIVHSLNIQVYHMYLLLAIARSTSKTHWKNNLTQFL